jgi:perosamine synthetase
MTISNLNRISFTEPLADSSDYPAPRFAPLPHRKGGQPPTPRPIVRNAITAGLVTRARYALGLIAKAELSSGDKVLLPAYHCPAMVEPFIWAGCKVVFYSITTDLRPDNDDLELHLSDASAVLFVRYFGFDENIRPLAEYARGRGCLVIEDLAHAAFIEELYGDYGVTSLPKFYPVRSGAELYIRCGRDCSAIEKSIDHYVVRNGAWLIRATRRKIGRILSASRGEKELNSCKFRYFDPIELARPLPTATPGEISANGHLEITRKRRQNYIDIHNTIGNSGLGIPFFSKLEANNTPYIYPFLLHNSSSFNAIRNAGIPLYRWEELSPAHCEVSLNFRSRLVQIPCHQDLTSTDISAIAAAFRASVNPAGDNQYQGAPP